MNEEIAELVGAIMGDGNIWSNDRWYEVTITGDKINDKEYFLYLKSLIEKNVKLNPYLRNRGGVRITIKSKTFYKFLTEELGIPSGITKRTKGIPNLIKTDQKLIRKFLRGVFDTDGSIFTSNKKGSLDYPTLEITNKNEVLMTEIYSNLIDFGYRAKIRLFNGTYKISLNGHSMVRKWNSEIGSSNKYKSEKLDKILNLNSPNKFRRRSSSVGRASG